MSTDNNDSKLVIFFPPPIAQNQVSHVFFLSSKCFLALCAALPEDVASLH